MIRKYTNAGFVVEAEPMTKFKYVCQYEQPIQETRYVDGVPTHPIYREWYFWKGYKITWNGYTFWQKERDFHEKWTPVEQKIAHIVEIKEYYLCDIVDKIGDSDWEDYEYIDQIEHLIHDDAILDEDKVNYVDNIQITILNENCCDENS